MRMTDWVEYKEGSARYRIQAHYGIDRGFAARYNQDAHFSITCDIEEMRGGKWRESGGGAAHEITTRHFPKLAPLIKWHLCGVETGPMHYLANALYWLDIAAGRVPPSQYGPEPMEAFRSTIVYGALPVDAAFDLERAPASLDREVIRLWLESRLPALLSVFKTDMALAEVL